MISMDDVQSASETELEKQLRYWRTRLQGAALQLELPTDRPRPSGRSHCWENVAVVLHATSVAQLRGLARRHDMTLFMVLYAAWALLLARLSGREDVVIGTLIAGRRRPETAELNGSSFSTLPLRVSVQENLALSDFLQQAKEVTLGAYEHQDVSFEHILEMLQPEARLGRDRRFQVGLALQSAPGSEPRLPVLTTRVKESEPSEPAVSDLLLSLEERGEEIVASLEYAADLFTRQTMQRWLACFSVLIQDMTVAEAGCSIGELRFLPDAERHQVIELFNQTKVAYPREKLIQNLFEEQVQRTPDAVAAIYGGHSLTYAELNARANQLARYLGRRGVGPDQLAGICVERSVDMVVGLLGILKAGGAYVPLDPRYPSERLQYMLSDAAPRVLLTQGPLRERLPRTTAELIVLDEQWNEIAQELRDDPDALAAGLKSHHLAYVIYTSGSTGQPKGVMVEHRGVVNFLTSMGRDPGIGTADRVLAVTTVSFDIAALEIYLPLVNGAKLVLASREAASDAQLLMSMIEDCDITVLQATPATWKLLLGAQWRGRSTLKALCGGEAMTADLAEKLLSRVGALWNLYGPTETTIWSCLQPISPTREKRGAVESIGRPISNTRIYVLDALQRAVPVGVEGEIYIGGAGVARGYLNRPELTAQRFVADPFVSDLPAGDSIASRSVTPARLYKTGDLGKWCADGTVEYIGRNDQQVKIRGFRIELGEIEAQLMRHESIIEAAVIARETESWSGGESGEKILVAYVVARQVQAGEAVLSAEVLRAYLKARLPEYMVPSAFVLLTQLPLTANGKLDRRALPAPAMAGNERQEYAPPQGELEQMLAGLWQEVLHVERVGREDNFFDRGGHSLAATQALTRIRSWLSTDIPMRVLFDFPVLKELAVALNKLVEAHLLDNMATKGSQLEELLSNMDSLSEEAVQELLRELEGGELS